MANAARPVDVNATVGMQLAWHPDEGRALAMPAKATLGDVSVCDRLRWGRAGAVELSGVHADVAPLVAYSPNGARLPALCACCFSALVVSVRSVFQCACFSVRLLFQCVVSLRLVFPCDWCFTALGVSLRLVLQCAAVGCLR